MSERLSDERLAQIVRRSSVVFDERWSSTELNTMARELLERRAAQAGIEEKIHQLEQRVYALSAVAAAVVQAVEREIR